MKVDNILFYTFRHIVLTFNLLRKFSLIIDFALIARLAKEALVWCILVCHPDCQ